MVDGTEKISFIEKGAGVYALPKTFKLKAGSTYKLFFSKADGTKYESSDDKVTTVPEIIKVHDEFEAKGIEKGINTYDPANYVYLDTQDPVNDKNNYLWSCGLAHPRSAVANGGIYQWKDGRTNADTMTVVFDYGPAEIFLS